MKVLISTIAVIMLITIPIAAKGQIKSVITFKNVKIPLTLTYKDIEIKPGTYNFEMIRNKNQGQFYLRIIKGRKRLCEVRGENYPYIEERITDMPQNPTFGMTKLSEDELSVIIETGTTTSLYALTRIKFILGYK